MRAAAFVFSLLTALYGVVVLVSFLAPEMAGLTPLADVFASVSPGTREVLLAMFFALPVLSIVGGGITLQFLWPGVLLTLVAGAAWVFVGILLGLGVSLNAFNFVPLVLCGLAAVLSFLGGFESERIAAWIAGLLAVACAGLLGFLIYDYYRGDGSMFFDERPAAVTGVRVPRVDPAPEPDPQEDEGTDAGENDAPFDEPVGRPPLQLRGNNT